jgi:hypothetical protein
VSPWKIEKKSSNTCLVKIDQTDVYDIGIWSCNLESLPNERYLSTASNIDLRFVEQPKLSMQEPVNLKVEDSEIHTFKCQVRIKAIETGPKPFQEFELLHGAGQW